MSREGRKRWDFFWRKSSRFLIGASNPAGPMMQRWRLIQTPWFGIYVHFIYREDMDRTPHDHPWEFRSIVLRGAYMEERHPDIRANGFAHPDNLYRTHHSWREAPVREIIQRFPLADAHRIVAVLPGTVTLCIVGRRQRSWGFWEPENGFEARWTDYRNSEALRPTEGVSM
jgi:hypothetical protein